MLRRLRESLPPVVQLAITRSTPAGFQDWVVDRAQRKDLDWSVTPGFALVCGQSGLIRLNLVGREKEGILTPGSDLCTRYVAWVKESLRELRAADSDAPIVASIADVAHQFPGPRSSFLPDMSVRWTAMEPVMEVHSDRLGRVTAHFGTGRPGNHTAAAFAVVMGDREQAAAFDSLKHTTDFADAVFRSLAPEAERGRSRAVH